MNQRQSRPAIALALYTVLVITLGALLAPWLYWFVQWLAANADAFHWLQRHPFKRVFNRTVMVIALIGLWPLLKNVGIRSWAEIGYVRARGWFRQFSLGYACGLLSISLAVGISIALGRRQLQFDQSSVEVLLLALEFLAVGLVVAVIEETFFRGALQGVLQKAMPWITALVITSVIYSALHFLKPKGVRILPEDVNALSGFACIGHIFSRSLGTEGVAVGFVSLLIAGMILGWVFQRTGALYLPMGLHAGWVLVNELVRALGGGQIIEDWITWVALIVLWIGLGKFMPARTTRLKACGTLA